MNKAILAIVVVVAAAAVIFSVSQLTTFQLNLPSGSIPNIIAENQSIDAASPANPGPDRDKVDASALKVGQINNLEPASATNLSLPDLFQKVDKSVVQITDSDTTNPIESRLGSGFVFDDNAHIVTNFHVVAGGGRLDVTFSDGTIYRAALIGSDPYTDLAVLYLPDVPNDKLAPLPLADSSTLRVGQDVAAIGNPFGLSGSMTSGIVSGLGRLIPSQQLSSSLTPYSIPDVIQTDAPINPGNSGGPLLNLQGEVIGITSAIFSRTGEFSGVGFAIPSNTMKKIVPSLITTGTFKHPWLGVSGTDMTPGIAEAIGLKEPRGFLIVDVVAGSPAEKAGLKGGDKSTTIDGRPIDLGGDVIVSIDGKLVRKIDDILVYLQREKSVGDNLQLTIMREGKTMQISVALGVRPGLQETP